MKWWLLTITSGVLLMLCIGTLRRQSHRENMERPQLFSPGPGKRGMTELHYAAYCGDPDAVAEYLTHGMKVDSKDDAGYTPLHWAVDMAMANHAPERVMAVLLDAGADINARDNDGNTVLMVACTAGNPRVVQQLVKAGASVKLRSKRSTPLIEAGGNADIVGLLLENGADPSERDAQGHTALDNAIRAKFTEVTRLLEGAGKPQPPTRPAFATVEGCQVPDLTGIHEGYSETSADGYQVFTVNVSAENIATTFLRLAELPRGPVFFTIEVGTCKDVEATLRKKDSDPLHRDVYYLDGLSPEAAGKVFTAYERIFANDGEINFGIGSHQKHDEVFVGAYKVFYIYTVEPDKYRLALDAMGFRAEPKIKTVWKTFTPDLPGKRAVLTKTTKTIWDVVEELKKQGLRLAERRDD